MIKSGVQLLNLQPQLAVAYTIAASVYARFGVPCVITSGCDSKHSDRSKHYTGHAIDLRTRDVVRGQHRDLRDQLSDALGDEFDVVLEDNHIHVEYDPPRTSRA